MLKRILALVFCGILLLSFAACGPAEENPAGADASAATGSDARSESGSSDSGDELKGYDESISHKFLATDITRHSVVIYDLDLAEEVYDNLLTDKCIVWEWDADDDPTCTVKPGAGIDAAKYRYSEYYDCYVVIACSSAGGAYVIDYETKKTLWNYNIGDGPHSIEMMPNGDVAVACSAGADAGKLSYVPLSTGATEPSDEIFSPSCHGVEWDPENECLWVLEYEEVYCCLVKDYGTENAKLTRVNGSGYDFGATKEDTSGHVLTPVYGEPGKYWVAGGKLWQFDSETEELTRAYSNCSTYSNPMSSLKGVAYFSDGTMVQTIAQWSSEEKGETTKEWSCAGFRILIPEISSGKVKKIILKEYEVYFAPSDREFYKVYPFTEDYQ